MNKKKLRIWGRDFELDVVYKTYSEQNLLESQMLAVEEFQSEVIDSVEEKIEKYILKNNNNQLGRESIDNIFKYVMPKSIYVPRTKEKKIIAVLCYYKFDMEHGLAIVFENNELKEIGEEDIVL